MEGFEPVLFEDDRVRVSRNANGEIVLEHKGEKPFSISIEIGEVSFQVDSEDGNPAFIRVCGRPALFVCGREKR